MADHQRKLIRHAIKDALLNQTRADDRVFPTRKLPLRTVELPAIAIYTLEEDVDDDSAQRAPRELDRDMPVTIEAWISDSDDVDNIDDDMDAFCLEIETAMHADPYFGATAADSILAGTVLEAIEIGDRMLGMIALTYNVKYNTLAPEAPTDLDDFNSVTAEHRPGDVQKPEQAEDDFEVQA